MPSALVVGVCKRRATPDQSVKIRSFDLGIAKRMNRVKRLIIGKDEQQIRAVLGAKSRVR